MSAPATATNVRPIRTAEPVSAKNGLRDLLQVWLSPHEETQMVSQQAKGVFLPYPLLAILITVGVLVVSGIIAIQVQVSNLNTTLLLRDADARAQMAQLQDKLSVLEVYLHNDRERIIKIETQKETEESKRR